jgi:hypothetical protein
MSVIQWGITLIVGILTFFGGRFYEKRKLEQENRLKLLEPVEAWIDKCSRMISIIGSEIPSLAEGNYKSGIYNKSEIVETEKYMEENTDKVIGILNSTALSTFTTKNISQRLSELILMLKNDITIKLLPKHSLLVYNKKSGNVDGKEIFESLLLVKQIKSTIVEIHSCISKLKTRYN